MNTQAKAVVHEESGTVHKNGRVFGVMMFLIAFGLLALVPYGLTIAGQELNMETLSTLPLQFMSQIILYSILVWIGLKLGAKVNLETPVLSAWLSGTGRKELLQPLGGSLLLGVTAGLGMILLDVFLFVPRLKTELQIVGETVQPPAWQGFLASFYGGIVEEVMMRFFMMTLLVWVGSKIRRDEDGQPGKRIIWAAILISGLAFGVAHLPSAVSLGIELSPLYVIRTLVLNGVGILYGWLYWKRGFENAMVAHFSTDLVIHVLGVLFLS